jgi:organic hydroperoxide reductase OsmC/OhrA
MEDKHLYRVVAWWAAGRTGLAKADSAPNAVHFAAPPQFGGLEGRWTPEDLLLCAVASCFTTTFQAIAGYSRFEYTDLEVQAAGMVEKTESGYRFTDITLHTKLTIPSEELRERGLALLHKAKGLCLVSKALATAPKVETLVEVAKLTQVG